MKIAVIGAKGLPPRQGGIEHHCAEIYPRIVAQGHSVDLYARSYYVDIPAFDEYYYQDVRVISVPFHGFKGLDAIASSSISSVVCTQKHYDIVHFHALGPSLFSWIPKFFSASKIIVTCHGLDWQRSKWGKLSSQVILWGEEAAVRYADRLVVVSEELRAYFRKTYDRETVYIPNAPATYPASDAQFKFARSLGLEPGQYLLFLGRLVPEKCPDLLIQAFQRLTGRGWRLALVGDTGDTQSFTSSLLTAAAGNPDVVFTGELRGSRLAEVVRGAGLFVLPSKVEGMPLAMLEAMNEGIPVVASDILPHRQLVGSDRGILFRSGDSASLVRGLTWALDHGTEMQVMAKTALQYIQQNYTWSQIAADNLRLYEALLNQTPATLPAVKSKVSIGTD